MKTDTRFGELLDGEFRKVYGDDFQWGQATIRKDDGGDYVVDVDTIKPTREVFPGDMGKSMKWRREHEGQII